MSHSFDIFNVNHFSIFIWMLHSVQESYKTIFSASNAFNDDFRRLFTILIQNFEFITKIIENSTVSSSKFSTYELNIVGPALLI